MQDANTRASLYPSCTSMDELIVDAKTRLPISTENQLLGVIHLVHNTVYNLLQKELTK